jgi:hypothetical protein
MFQLEQEAAMAGLGKKQVPFQKITGAKVVGTWLNW